MLKRALGDESDSDQHRRYREAIATHIRTLKKDHQAFLKSEEQRRLYLKECAKNTRRQTVCPYLFGLGSPAKSWPQLFHQRRDLTITIPALQRHRALIDHLGPDGMSSDEEITTPGTYNFRYAIHPPQFRSEQVTILLRKLDRITRIQRTGESSETRRGNKPRLRVLSAAKSAARYVSGLPGNAYDDDWMKTKGQAFVFLNVRPTPEPYDFSMDAQLEEYVCYATLP